MSRSKEIEHAIGRYLEKVAAQMGDVAPDEKDNILREVESHVYAALDRRGGDSATLEDLETVLAEMAAPAEYARSLQAGAAEDTAKGARICGHAMAAGLMLPLGFAWLALWILLGRYHGINEAFRDVAPWILFVLGALGVTVSPVLGFAGISCIKGSKGRLTGMPLAVAAAFVYPVLMLDAFIIFCACASATAIANGLTDMGSSILVVVWTFLTVPTVVCLTVWMFLRAWKWASGKADAERTAAAPSSYGAKANAVVQPSLMGQSERKLCKLPIIAAVWAPFGVVAFLMHCIAVSVPADSPWPPLWYKILAMGIILPLGATAPFATTALGLIAISKIRASRRMLVGLPLAVGASVLYPVIILDAFVAIVLHVGSKEMTMKLPGGWPPVLVIAGAVLVTLVCVTWLTIWVPRTVWRWATRPVKEGEFT